MMKKVFALILALMLVCALAACGDDAAAPNKQPAGNSEAQTEAEGLTLELKGLTLCPPEDYELLLSGANSHNFYNDDADIEFRYEGEGDFADSKAAAEFYAEAMKAWEYGIIEVKEHNGISYIVCMEEGENTARVIAYYVNGADWWQVNANVKDYEGFGADGVDVITGGKFD